MTLAPTVAVATPATGESRPAAGTSDRIGQHSTGEGAEPAFVPGDVIVRFRAGVGPVQRHAARRATGADFDRTLRLPRAQLVDVEGGVRSAVERLESRPEVAYAQPNYIYRALADQPNDPRFDQLWGLDAVDALAGWDAARGDGQVIAVVDTGVDLTHPDLIPRLWVNPSPDAIVHDVHGYDFVDDDGDPDDFHHHGTHVAGTAAATADNGVGIAGVAPAAQIMAVRVLDGNGSGTTEDVADGVDYAASHGASVLNLSLGGPVDEDGDPETASDPALSDAVARAGALHDAVVVAAAGNGGDDGIGDDNDATPQSPCQSVDLTQPSNLICVAATQADGQLTSFSNWGAESVHLAAPGQAIWSTRAPYQRIYPEDGAADGFEDAGVFASTWTGFLGTDEWARDSSFASGGAFSAADSPAANYLPGADTSLVTAGDYSFAGRRGCRMHFDLRLRRGADDGDVMEAGLLVDGVDLVRYTITSQTGSAFEPLELLFGNLDGEATVAPTFTFAADGDPTVGEGANVDELELLCRSNAYGTSSYQPLSGTSMAAPHVAGVAALVRSAVPGATAPQTIAALVGGVRPLMPTPGKPTATNGLVSAPGALAAAGWAPLLPPISPTSSPTAGSPAPVAATPLRKPDLSSSPQRLRVNRFRRVTYGFRATPRLRGEVIARTRVKAATRTGRLRHLIIARKGFLVPISGRATLRLRLTPGQLRILRLNHRLRLLVRVTVSDRDGRTATASKRLLLLPPRAR